MFCMKCGMELPDDTNFCPKCGFAFGNAQMQNTFEEPATRQIKVIRKQSFQGSAINLEVNLMDDYGDCVEANALYNGSSCFMTCRCDSKYHLSVNSVGGIGRKVSEATIEPGDRNLTAVLSFSKMSGKILIDIS